ncbi:hypothetical protein MP638_001797 [Amoeboaphelidium occidentale]|nr:hypothetical protein MP638_001797 [Amoeboaphelidium occidentale]
MSVDISVEVIVNRRLTDSAWEHFRDSAFREIDFMNDSIMEIISHFNTLKSNEDTKKYQSDIIDLNRELGFKRVELHNGKELTVADLKYMRSLYDDIMASREKNADISNSSNGRVLAFWDFENCKIPRGYQLNGNIASRISECVKDKLRLEIDRLYCFGDQQVLPSNAALNLEESNKVEIIESTSGKNSADVCLTAHMMMTAKRGDTIVLISGDCDFSVPVSLLKKLGCRIIIIYLSSVRSSFLEMADDAIGWMDVLGLAHASFNSEDSVFDDLVKYLQRPLNASRDVSLADVGNSLKGMAQAYNYNSVLQFVKAAEEKGIIEVYEKDTGHKFVRLSKDNGEERRFTQKDSSNERTGKSTSSSSTDPSSIPPKFGPDIKLQPMAKFDRKRVYCKFRENCRSTNCPYAHNENEKLPTNYKTEICRYGSQCTLLNCTRAHTQGELQPKFTGQAFSDNLK